MEIKRVGIVGMGLMGVGIARHLASLGINTTILKWTKGPYAEARNTFLNVLHKEVARDKLTETDVVNICSHLIWTDKPENLGECDLVIESIAEGKRVKRDCLRKLDSFIRKDAIVATNTSTLKIGVLAQALSNPSRFIGLHFFNPAHKMTLVEVVVTSKTQSRLRDDAMEFVRRIGKEPVLVHSSPGFIVNRLLVAQMLEAVKLVFGEQLVAEDVVVVDRAMKGINHPMGPFELMDLIGIDVVHAMASNLYAGLKQKHFEAPLLLEHMVEHGYLGRKSGIGFYDYRSDAKNPKPNTVVRELMDEPSE
ncbi:MAG: 3-hydroxyacyl-CoA dehydrogenase family protein [Patescibacteria group bacterium]